LLEKTLLKHLFNFKLAAREISRQVNDDNSNNWFQIDARILQARWTDIELRNHVLPNLQANNIEDMVSASEDE